jgi:hypothetical protein
MNRVTVDQVMSWKPCERYTRELIEQLFAGRESLSAVDILKLDIPTEDRLWAVLREELIPAPVLHEFACGCAEQALLSERKAGREPDPRSWTAIETKRRWLRGEAANEELKAAEEAARAAAWEAARAAAWEAARAAARAAAWEAAWEVARAAAWEAAWEAARAATWEATWAAARAEQVKYLLAALEGGGGE